VLWQYHLQSSQLDESKLEPPLSFTIPVLAVGGEYNPTLGGNVTINFTFSAMRALAQNVQGILVPDSGHWIAEERPDFVIKMLNCAASTHR
jgi:pimeloyl-ACP methyl ester carboxylesterase